MKTFYVRPWMLSENGITPYVKPLLRVTVNRCGTLCAEYVGRQGREGKAREDATEKGWLLLPPEIESPVGLPIDQVFERAINLARV